MEKDIENKILSFFALGYGIDIILKELTIDEEELADIIIDLEDKGIIFTENKIWTLTEKGKDLLKEKKELLKRIKIDYLYGNINKDEFDKKRKELESIFIIEKNLEETKEKKSEIKEKKLICQKCGKENKTGSKYCYKCGIPLKTE